MDPATIGLLISMLGSTVKGVSDLAKSGKEKDYKKRMSEYNERKNLKSEKDARRAALKNAIGSDIIFAPRPEEEAPKEPDYRAENITGYLGGIGATAGMDSAAGFLQDSAGLPMTGKSVNNVPAETPEVDKYKLPSAIGAAGRKGVMTKGAY
jgi:hypothetical protein